MTPGEAHKRIIGDEWLANLQQTLTRTDDLINQWRAPSFCARVPCWLASSKSSSCEVEMGLRYQFERNIEALEFVQESGELEHRGPKSE